jgi:hypothetical protein
MIWLVILAMGMLAGTVGGIVGFGGSNILLPVLVLAFGPKDAVPIMGLAGALANLARVGVWWREVDWRAAAIYAATGVPAVIVGARLFLTLDARVVEGGLGVFMLVMVPLRRWFMAHNLTIGLGGLAAAGAGIGFLTGLVSSTGPISTPVFLACGLTKGAFIATEALGSLAIYGTKTLVFGHAGALTGELVVRGLIIGAAMMAGAWIAKRFVSSMDGRRFQSLLDAMMLLAGIAMIAGALW